MNYVVAYVGPNARRFYLPEARTRESAIAGMKALKKKGYTTWVETQDGVFEPVPGAMRSPSWLDDQGKTCTHGKKS